MTEEQIKNLLEQAMVVVKYSLIAAASETLGYDRTITDKYFKLAGYQISNGEKDYAIVVTETATVSEKKYNVIIPLELVTVTDCDYYPKLRELAQLAAPFIPEEEKKFHPVGWPDPPVWKDLEEISD